MFAVEEHAEIKRLVHEVDTASTNSSDFDAIVSRAVTAFITHAKEEEDEQLPLIRQKLSPEDNDVGSLLLFQRVFDMLICYPLMSEDRPPIPQGAQDRPDTPASRRSPNRRPCSEGSGPAGRCPRQGML